MLSAKRSGLSAQLAIEVRPGDGSGRHLDHDLTWLGTRLRVPNSANLPSPENTSGIQEWRLRGALEAPVLADAFRWRCQALRETVYSECVVAPDSTGFALTRSSMVIVSLSCTRRFSSRSADPVKW